MITRAWHSISCNNPVTRIQKKIAATRRELKKWATEKFRKRDTYLSTSKWVLQQLDRVEECRTLNTHEFGLRIQLREHIFQLASDQEARWKQRSGVTWLKLGDKNTKFFHAVANKRKNVNSITSLPREGAADDEGRIADDQLPNFLLSHFRNIMGTTAPLSRPFDLSGKIGPGLEEQLWTLDDPITEGKIHSSLKDMPTGKASGPDGFPIEFYQSFWPIVKRDIVEFVNSFFGRTPPLSDILIERLSL